MHKPGGRGVRGVRDGRGIDMERALPNTGVYVEFIRIDRTKDFSNERLDSLTD